MIYRIPFNNIINIYIYVTSIIDMDDVFFRGFHIIGT